MTDPRDWQGWPPRSPPPSPSYNGHESLMMGQLLGELKAGQTREIYVLELIARKIDDLPARIAETIANAAPAAVSAAPPASTSPALPTPAPEDRLNLKDWLQIAIAGVILMAAITGKMTWAQAIGAMGKPWGF